MNYYRRFIDNFIANMQEAEKLPLGDMPPCARPEPRADIAPVIIFSPHPDDECIIGALPLRLLRQEKMRVINVAVTQGSLASRRQARLEELREACNFLGFELKPTCKGGLEAIRPATRREAPEQWLDAVACIRDILAEQRPGIIFVPHAEDWNGTHVGTHFLVMDALAAMPVDFSCRVVETEYWQPMSTPNLMVECAPELVADLVAGLSFHSGEVSRNPYHIGLPAWLRDNVRRGSELVGGQGNCAPDFPFATLYRVGDWRNGQLREFMPATAILRAEQCPGTALKTN